MREADRGEHAEERAFTRAGRGREVSEQDSEWYDARAEIASTAAGFRTGPVRPIAAPTNVR
jgi:hypothetical protein